MSRYAMCPVCGHRMRRDRDSFGDWDGETYICDYCTGEDYENDDDEYGERLDDYNAGLAWLCSGMDEDQTFGYTEDELRNALK